MNSQTTTDFLRDLLGCYPTQPILLLWDRAHWHKGAAVKALLAQSSRLEMVFFPPACPDLNPQEHIWSQARTAVSHNHTYSTFHLLKRACLKCLSLTLFRFDWLAKYAPAILFEV
jgi:transposase